MSLLFKNNVTAALTASAAPTDTTLYVSPTDAAKFPTIAPGSNNTFYATLTNAGQRLAYEVVLCTFTDPASGQLVVQRGRDGTTAQSWQAGDQLLMLQNAGAMAAMLQTIDFQNGKYTSGTATSTEENKIVIDLPGNWSPNSGGSGYAWIFFSPITNTGPVTVTVRVGGTDWYTGLPLRNEKGADLVAGDIVTDWPMSLCLAVRSGVGVPMILLNPRAASVAPTAQAYVNVAGERGFSTDYENTGSRPITVQIALGGTSDASAELTVDGVRVAAMGTGSAVISTLTAIVNPGSKYRVNPTGAITVNTWVEYK